VRRPRGLLPVALAAAALGLASSSSDHVRPAQLAGASASDPVAGLSVSQLAGQRIIFSFQGTRPPSGLLRGIGLGEASGVILFRSNFHSRAGLRELVQRLQAVRRPPGLTAPLLIMVDQEGGVVKRVSGPPRHSPAQLGRIGSSSLARAEGRATAANLRSLGINVDLAPVLDVGRRGSYQWRTGRSYSPSARLVASLGTGFAAGLQSRRVAATLKHFPGLGTVPENEDKLVQRVDLPLDRLRRLDEAPFAAAVRAGARLVMTSTGRYPALAATPALFARRITTDELRGHLRFRGVSITDDLEVPALRRYGSLERRARLAERAGNDLLLYASSFEGGVRGLRAITAEASAGRPDLTEMRQSVRRILELRETVR
jgi:beta-N-acetylhexosaminidase